MVNFGFVASAPGTSDSPFDSSVRPNRALAIDVLLLEAADLSSRVVDTATVVRSQYYGEDRKQHKECALL